MSLILEALKRSEQQRQREKAPSLQSIHQPVAIAAKKSVHPWWILLAIIVICNAAFFGYWFWRQQGAVADGAQKTQVATVAAPPSTMPVEKSARATPSTSLPSTETAKPREAQPEFTRIAPRESTAQPEPATAAQRIEEVSELPDSVRNNLPAMTFSFHVYSENPEQRTIIINDRRVREGDDISAGVKLQSITQDGVILLFEQHRIHINVLSDW